VVILRAESVLWTATVVWLLWRLLLWRRRGTLDPAREATIAGLFVWTLLVTKVTMFPLTIIFYDWHGGMNLTPFSSIVEILRTTSPQFAVENIGGNVVMFIPFGFLMPALFDRVRRPGAILRRAAAVSVLIEFAQYVTQARSVDIDDVILNTTGALIGFGAFTAVAQLANRTSVGQRMATRLATSSKREPLLTAALPFLVTVAIAVPLMLSTIVANTLDGGSNGIEAVAIEELDAGEVVARSDIGDHTFLVATEQTITGQQLVLTEFKKILPGRYTWLGTSNRESGTGSTYQYYYPGFNPSAGEHPMVIVWGHNADQAASVHITGNAIDTVVPLDPGAVFVVGATFVYDEWADALDEFTFTFLDSRGRDLPAFHAASS
jgi:glycopeptide antibiotics resistance protein